MSRRVAWGTAITVLLLGTPLTATLTGCGPTVGDVAGEPVVSPSGSGTPMGASPTPGPGTVVDRFRIAGRSAVLTRTRHPRGGGQWHLVVAEVGEVREHGVPVLPSVATDTRPLARIGATCTGDGFRRVVAQPRMADGRYRWDVTMTRFRLGSAGFQAGPQQRAWGLDRHRLVLRFPALGRRPFGDC